jgi:tetratricopeptide (TPR) repeat protein
MTFNYKNNPDLSSKSDKDHLRDVITALDSELLKNDANTQTLFLRANAYLDSGKHIEAIYDYEKILEIDTNHTTVWNNRGICLRLIGQTEEALVSFNKAIKLNENYRDAYNNRGMVLSDIGDLNAAILDFTRAINLDSEYWYAFNNRGMALWASGKKTEAIADYERAKIILNKE